MPVEDHYADIYISEWEDKITIITKLPVSPVGLEPAVIWLCHEPVGQLTLVLHQFVERVTPCPNLFTLLASKKFAKKKNLRDNDRLIEKMVSNLNISQHREESSNLTTEP
uniref:Rap-GAP domain-containing protein n=1 Tax=Heterorhabditis bacteriophora TaxID=37862 RepID=A0A1I7WJY5_HETBA